ncbi:DUF998 domain-containing protein [Hamadaea sp. NPDC051192]|uniref:DUF998 domain-containing protein n=1 Tax=Hamadaea sp. NPDC051192 TaxID=3154940 RepID=UPI00342F3A3E
MASRAVAATAAVLGAISGLLLVRAVAPGALDDYVSASGVPGQPHPASYRLGIYGLALTAGLLAWVTRSIVALPLAVAVPMIALSGSVACTPGCPLPPYEQSTAQDLLHATTSILGVGLCALAMLAAAWRGSTFSRIAVFVTWPLLAGTAIGIVAVGRGAVTGVLERLGLVACVVWLVGFAVQLTRRPPPHG